MLERQIERASPVTELLWLGTHQVQDEVDASGFARNSVEVGVDLRFVERVHFGGLGHATSILNRGYQVLEVGRVRPERNTVAP